MIYAQKFETMDSFFKFITTAQNNKVFADEHDSDRNSEGFAGTKNFAEAAELFRNGWDAGLEKSRQGRGETFLAQRPGRLCVITTSGLALMSPELCRACLTL